MTTPDHAHVVALARMLLHDGDWTLTREERAYRILTTRNETVRAALLAAFTDEELFEYLGERLAEKNVHLAMTPLARADDPEHPDPFVADHEGRERLRAAVDLARAWREYRADVGLDNESPWHARAAAHAAFRAGWHQGADPSGWYVGNASEHDREFLRREQAWETYRREAPSLRGDAARFALTAYKAFVAGWKREWGAPEPLRAAPEDEGLRQPWIDDQSPEKGDGSDDKADTAPERPDPIIAALEALLAAILKPSR